MAKAIWVSKETLTNGIYISYTYDSAGRRVQMRDYFGGQTTYTYDALGRLVSIVNPYGEMTTFQYDANSRLIRKNLSNGTYTTYSYNSRGFLLGIANYKSNGTLITYANYTYDAVGNRLSMTTPEGTYSYTYDAIYRLTGEVNPVGGTYSYTYDGVGNRLSMTHNGVTTNYTYDAGNKLLQAGTTTFTYDGNGNMVSKTENGQTTTYVYNYEDKMVQVNLPGGGTVNYSYDHEGKRIGKTAGGTTIDYYFDGDDLIIEAQGTNILAYYTQGEGLISQRRNNASYFYHYDGLGSTKALTDVNQNIQSSYVYDAWGNILQSSGTITNPYLYVGELGYYGDGDSGMYLLTQRWYSSVLGRFVVRDPLSRAIRPRKGGGSSVYSDFAPYMYGADSPVNMIDPTGLVTISECMDEFWKCMEYAETEYQRCMCYMKQAPLDKPTAYGCSAFCGGLCAIAGYFIGKGLGTSPTVSTGKSGIGGIFIGGALGALCLKICLDLCSQGVGKIAEVVGKRICGELRETIKGNCYDAFELCRQRAHRVRQ